MEAHKTKRPVYIYYAICLVLLAASLLLIQWVKENTQAATRLLAQQLVENGAGYELAANEAADTYVLGDYTAKVSSDGITLMSARGEERLHYDTGFLDPYVLQDGSMLAVGSAESQMLYVLDRNGDYVRVHAGGEPVSVYAEQDRLLVIAKTVNGGSAVSLIDLKTAHASEIRTFKAGEEPMRARFSPNGQFIDILVMPVYSGDDVPRLVRVDADGSEVAIDLDPAGLVADFLYLPDGGLAVLGASGISVINTASLRPERSERLDRTSGMWLVSGRLVALAGAEGGGFALYDLTESAVPLVQLAEAPVIMPALSDTYGIVVSDNTLQLIDLRGARLLDAFPLTQKIHRVEFTGPTDVLVIADGGVYPFSVQ